MSEYDFDLLVIGAGSGGVRAARMAAGYGAKVGICEDRYLGGTCVNVGCVPKKLFVYASSFSELFHEAQGFGWSVKGTDFNWDTLINNKNHEISRLNGVYEKLLKNSGVTLFDGKGTFVDEHTVSVNGTHHTAERIIIATGGWPNVPDIPGKEHIITSNEAFFLDDLPEIITIVGGGYIAVEFAGIFNGLGVETHLIYRGDMFLRGFDDDIRKHLFDEMQKKGVHIHLQTNIASIAENGDSYSLTLESGVSLISNKVMYATGRIPNTEGLGLENTGVELNDKGAIVVNKEFQTTVDNIYAIGDVIDRVQLTPVALAEGMYLARNFYQQDLLREVDYENIPTAVFSQPNIGTVGLTEEQAREQFGDVDIYLSRFTPMKLSLTDVDEKTLMKLIVDKGSNKVLGVHMVGPDAGEIIQGIAIAIKAGATKEDFDRTIGIHPTAAEEFVTMREPSR